MLNVVSGGTLYQSMHSQREEEVMQHLQKAERSHRSHLVKVEKDSRMFEMLQEEELKVNSFHHQAVNEVGKDLRIVAKAPDGIIEGIESTKHKAQSTNLYLVSSGIQRNLLLKVMKHQSVCLKNILKQRERNEKTHSSCEILMNAFLIYYRYFLK